MNNNSHLVEKVAKQSKQIAKLKRDMNNMQAQMDKLMGDNFQVYLDNAIKEGVSNYELKELLSEPLVGSNSPYSSDGESS